jgi:5-methyltetrahydrofolate--homocysteine methyltransferase
VLIIGESINGTIKKVGEAILDRNEAFIRELAVIQRQSGAAMLDVNAGVAEGNEIADLAWLVEVVQKEVPVPLMIDSADPAAIEAALAVHRHEDLPIVNSISGEAKKWASLFPLIIEKKPRVVVLCMDDKGIPKTVERRIEIAGRLFGRLTDGGISPSNIYFDPLALSVAVEPDQALVSLDTIRVLRSTFSGSHIICGVSNISMGLPARRLLNRTFLVMATYAGLDTIFADVRDEGLLSSIYASKVIINQDFYCTEYLSAYRGNKILG